MTQRTSVWIVEAQIAGRWVVTAGKAWISRRLAREHINVTVYFYPTRVRRYDRVVDRTRKETK